MYMFGFFHFPCYLNSYKKNSDENFTPRSGASAGRQNQSYRRPLSNLTIGMTTNCTTI